MQILVVTDLHYRLKSFDWLIGRAPDVDIIAITGDLADVASPVPMNVQIVVLDRYLTQLAEHATVLVVSGNHDLDGPGESGEQTARWLLRDRGGSVHADGRTVDMGRTRFTMCPWWDGPLTQAGVGRQLAAAAVDRPEQWVWLYHAPPAGTALCFDGRRSFPDQQLTDWIGQYSPDVVLTGHIHQAPWVDGGSWHDRVDRTHVFNPGRQIGNVPAHLTIDTELGTVDWFGVFSSESIGLFEGD